MRSRRFRGPSVLLALTLAGCARSSVPTVPRPDAGADAGPREESADAGTDSGTDAAARLDAGFDAGTDAGPCAVEAEPCIGGVCHAGACCAGCWDGAACRSGDAVSACGTAGGACATCDDADPCTVDSCEAGTCVATPVADFDPCATGGVCVSGNCAVQMHRPAEVTTLGVCTTSLGPDMDGDGLADLAVMYRTRIFDGDTTWVVAYRAVDGTPLWTWTSAGYDATYWPERPLAAVPDMDGDGLGDVLVGLPRSGGVGQAGSLTWISGDTGVAYRTTLGPSAGAYFGESVSAGYDLDGDGVPDAVVEAPDSAPPPGPEQPRELIVDGATGAIRAELLLVGIYRPASLGPDADGDGLADLVLTDRRGTRLLSGATLAERWSAARSDSVSLGPDVDGDGLGDVVGGVDAAAAHLWSGATGGELRTLDGVIFPVIGPDADGDGRGDLLVGSAPRRVELLSGVTGATIMGADAMYATSSIGPDADGDGVPDIAAGAARRVISEVVLLGSRGWVRR